MVMPRINPSRRPISPGPRRDRGNPGASLLPLGGGRPERVTLYALRRMAAHGLRDAHAANLMLNDFGIGFRRPLTLLRTMMFEMSRATRRKIALAPCCCHRITLDEARILAVLAHAAQDEPRARRHLTRLTGTADNAETAGPLCAAAAYNWALADLGRPLAL